MRTFLKSKIHRIVCDYCHVEYDGSISIPIPVMRKYDLLPYEQVHVVDIANGHRFVTYVLPSEDEFIEVNGGAARLVVPGDLLTIMSYEICDKPKLFGQEVVEYGEYTVIK